ncbi:hypothetical protein C8A00DRAFT_46158 [Chaetomidium leptoderma]|uniref:Uncharacterized protein n=1 Tax=Chaetomidium leptoderma TaxID=669021 RepID=A0AAN6VFQ5_9PEZI|nr:hypothetical protein C8A00DRAFT_46158 [Chaetomidium leptoderma]
MVLLVVGLGLAVVEVAGLRSPENPYILCSRDVAKGSEAAKKLREQAVTAPIHFYQLDVTNDEEITALVDYVDKIHGRVDVSVNNAGILRGMDMPPDAPASALRAAYTEALNVNVTSVAVVTHAFMPVLRKAPNPKVINVTSGLGCITNVLTPGKRMARACPRVAENDRAAVASGGAGAAEGGSSVRFYICNPGQGAESIVRIVEDDEGMYEGGMYWEFEDGR